MDTNELEYIPVDAERRSAVRLEIIMNGDGNLEIVVNDEPVVVY